MKAVLVTSIACAAITLLALLAVSAMSVAPGAEAWRDGLLVAAGVFLVGWSTLALWARGRRRLSRDAALSAGFKTAVIAGGLAYVLLVLLCCVG
jgi:hypothetical protein